MDNLIKYVALHLVYLHTGLFIRLQILDTSEANLVQYGHHF